MIPIMAAAGRPKRSAIKVQGVAPPQTPMRAPMVRNVPISMPVTTSSQTNS